MASGLRDSHASNFFRGLFAVSQQAVSELPISHDPPAMGYIIEVLEPAARALSSQRLFPDLTPELIAEQAVFVRVGDPRRRQAIGLNTVGMLLDRMSILSVKHWNIIHRAGRMEQAEELVKTQVEEIVLALADALPGYSSVNNKMTRLPFGRETTPSFSEAYTGLLFKNTALWEAQEVLYNHDIASLPDSELREYISFFSRGNLERNGFIQSCEQCYWSRIIGSEPAGLL